MKYHAPQYLPLHALRAGDRITVGGLVCEVTQLVQNGYGHTAIASIAGQLEVKVTNPDSRHHPARMAVIRPPLSPEEELARRLLRAVTSRAVAAWDAMPPTDRKHYLQMARAALLWGEGK